MSKPAGAPSEKSGRLPSSPDIRPSQLHRTDLFSSASCPVLPVTPSHVHRRYSNSIIEARSPEQLCHKHEAQYAMNLFGAQPEIDFTIKRGHGVFSPRQGGAGHAIVDVAGSRSEKSDMCEAAQTLRSWGAAPYIEVVGRRGTGSCSPRIERRDVEASCVRRQNYLQDCNRSGLSDISEVHKLGVGECSPRRTSEMGAVPENSIPANLISKEVRLASGQSKMARVVTISPRVFEVEVPYPSISRNSSSPSSPSWDCRRLLDTDESYDIPRWAHPTSASRARNAQDLSNVKLLHGCSSRTTRSGTTDSAASSSVGDTASACARSCRLGTESSSAASVSSSSRCMRSCRLGSETSSLSGSVSTSRCTHSCRVSQRSTFSSASTTSSLFPASQKSFKLAGDILSQLKLPKSGSRTPRPPSTFNSFFDASISDCQGWMIQPQGPKLAGNILSDLRSSPSRWKGSKACDESPMDANIVDS